MHVGLQVWLRRHGDVTGAPAVGRGRDAQIAAAGDHPEQPVHALVPWHRVGECRWLGPSGFVRRYWEGLLHPGRWRVVAPEFVQVFDQHAVPPPSFVVRV